MKDPFEQLGLGIYKVRYAVVPIWIVLTIVLGALFASQATTVLKGGGFYTPSSGSDNADRALAKYFHSGSSNQALVAFQSNTLTVDDPSFKNEVTAAETRLKGVAHVHSVTSYYDTTDPSSVSADKHTTYMPVALDGDSNTVTATVPKLRDQL